MLKSSSPKMDPCRTLKSSIWNILWTLLIFTDCFQRFRYEYTEAIGFHFGYK